MDPFTLTLRTWRAWTSMSLALADLQLSMARQMMTTGAPMPFAPSPPSICGPGRSRTPL